jgi:hypothetical protein
LDEFAAALNPAVAGFVAGSELDRVRRVVLELRHHGMLNIAWKGKKNI